MQHTITKIKSSLSGTFTNSEITYLTRIILEWVIKSPIPDYKNTKITQAQVIIIEQIIERLIKFEPIQYILGETEFYGIPLKVNKSVLIPRPETEELVETIINECEANENYNVIDIGTGSGCIAIALKKHLKLSNITGWDISQEALDVASINANLNQVHILLKKVDILSGYPTDQSFDIIVSNPPYIMESEKKDLEANVINYEPHTALFVPSDNPLLFYDKITDIAKTILKKNGKIYFEINSLKAQDTIQLLESKGFIDIERIKDISGNERIVKATHR